MWPSMQFKVMCFVAVYGMTDWIQNNNEAVFWGKHKLFQTIVYICTVDCQFCHPSIPLSPALPEKSTRSHNIQKTRKPSYRWQTRATRKSAKNCSNSTCLQRCRRRYSPIFNCLAVVSSEICEIPRNSLKIQTYGVQGHPRSSILVSIESPCTTVY